MSKTFNATSKINQVKEPLFQVSRVRYRGPRSSQQENLESNLLKLDLTRIYDELDSVDISILDYISIIVGDREEVTEETYLTDGLTNEIADLNFKLDQESLEFPLKIDTMEKLSGILTRLFNKVSRLEMS